MKFFLDTANLKELTEAKSIGILDGVTTNPTLISKENVFSKNDIYNHYQSICNIIGDTCDLSAEIISKNYNDIIQEGKILSSLHKNIVLKIPMTQDGLKAINFFSERNIRTNCTLVFSSAQAILAAKSGAYYVSPFIGRLDDISYNGIHLIEEMNYIYNNYQFNTRILAASIRNPIHIIECSKLGIYAITSPLNVIYSLFNHPLTNIGITKFIQDYKNKIK
ncbi:fructose-6-phosphate aldolase [Blattabacterium cuenoti]|uniref:fructose-6-phosphate aldolase n=1 Tax=Blattabacterium cuenoti TaxID=1653831 RepID=UPI00163C7D7B|nr:fructose-6-phosphate aldolase [Blattabacterium cuenoti]